MTHGTRVYHGIRSEGRERILVETSEGHPGWGKEVTVLQELAVTQSQASGLNWGYNGGGTSTSAAAILADALGLGGIDEGWRPELDPDYPNFDALREDFCVDFLVQFGDEWRLDRTAVLRWARGWYAQSGIQDLPKALQVLPPLLD